MRDKIYYTVDEITNNLFTPGFEWMLIDNTEYIGLYHTYTTGEVYTKAKFDRNTSKKLIPYRISEPSNEKYRELKPDIKTAYDTIKPHRASITEKDKKAGFIIRYFIQKVNSLNIQEINKDQYNAYQDKKLDPNICYYSIKMDNNWIIRTIIYRPNTC